MNDEHHEPLVRQPFGHVAIKLLDANAAVRAVQEQHRRPFALRLRIEPPDADVLAAKLERVADVRGRLALLALRRVLRPRDRRPPNRDVDADQHVNQKPPAVEVFSPHDPFSRG